MTKGLTKDELSQLRYLDKEIKYLKRQIERLSYEIQNVNQIISDTPKGSNNQNKTESIAIDLADYKSLLEVNVRRYWQEKEKIERFIGSLEDSKLRLIMRLRYINCLRWQEIAFEIGHYDESYPRRLHNKFLKNINRADYADSSVIN